MDRVSPAGLTDEPGAILEPPLPPAKRTVDPRLVIDTIFYLDEAGCRWAMLSKDLAKRSTACGSPNA